MTVILELSPEVEACLRRKAEQEGKDLTIFLQSVVEREAKEFDAEIIRRQAQREKNQAAIKMLEEWDEEDRTDDPKEIARRQAEWEEFKKGMNAAHTSDRIIYS